MVSLNPFTAARPNSPFVALKSGTGKHLLSGAFDGFCWIYGKKPGHQLTEPINSTNSFDSILNVRMICV